MKYVILIAVILVVSLIIYDVVRILKIKKAPALPCEDNKNLSMLGLSTVYEYFYDSTKIPEGIQLTDEYVINQLKDMLEYVNCRYDCSDFVCHMLFRFYKDYKDRLGNLAKEELEKVFLNFKYWVDMPGDDSLCYFSENHTLLYSSLEFLIGQEFPDKVFTNSSFKGAIHMERGKKRLMEWFELKGKYGFFEWYSSNYWNEDIGPILELLSFSKDEEVKSKAKSMMDLMMFEVVTHSADGRFITASARQYGDNKYISSIGNRMQYALDYLLYNKDEFDSIAHCKRSHLDNCMLSCSMMALRKGAYTLPEIFKEIAFDQSKQIIKTSNGLDPEEYKALGLIGQSQYQLMAQLSNEIFINKGFAYNTYLYHKNNNDFSNAFSDPLKYADFWLVRKLHILSALCNILNKNFAPTGSALTRGNVYTYRKNGYTLATAAKLHIDYCGNQHQFMHANLAEDVNVFLQYPFSLTRLAGAPGYWGGHRRLPMSVQHENVNLTIFRMDKKHRLAENKPIFITHALFPTEKFTESSLEGNYAFGRKDNKYIAIICNKPMHFAPYNKSSAMALVTHDQSSVVKNSFNTGTDEFILKKEFDLIAEGQGYNAYAVEVSDNLIESYEQFTNRIKSNEFLSKDNTLTYVSNNNVLYADYTGKFMVNGSDENTQYPRYDSSYCKAERGVKHMNINYKSMTYNIDLF